MVYRRRRRNRGTWFPTVKEQQDITDGEDDEIFIAGKQLQLTLDPTAEVVPFQVHFLTMDSPRDYQAADDANFSSSLADVIGSEYFLKRIVGKLHLLCTRDADNGDFDALITAGFFIARADDATTAGFENLTPVGWQNQGAKERLETFSPNAQSTIREPWIWRRSWVLSDRPVGNFHSFPAFPRSNADYGSLHDGPHIDAKTKRRVSNDDRLWFAIAACPFPVGRPIGEIGNASLTIDGFLDYRIFGSIRKAKNRGVF